MSDQQVSGESAPDGVQDQLDAQEQDAAAAPRRRLSRRMTVIIAAAAAAVLVVTGGAVAVAVAAGGTAGPQPRPEQSSTAGESPTPKPSPDPTQPAATPASDPVDPRPAPVFGIACADLVTSQMVVDIVGPSAVLSGGGPIRSLHDAAMEQAGALSCSWTPQPDGDRMYVNLMANAGSDFAGTVLAGPPEEGWEYDGAFGDASRHGCTTWAGGSQCTADILVGDTWVAVTLSGGGAPSDRTIVLTGVAEHVIGVVRGLSVGSPDTTSRTSVLTPEFMWDQAGALVADAFGPDLYASAYDEIPLFTGQIWMRTGYTWVPFESSGAGAGVGITTLPGGGWAALELGRTPGAVPVLVPGAEHASLVNLSGEQNLCLATRGAGMCISSEGASGDALVAKAGAFVASLPTA
jgi:hypothetical protein